MLQVLRKLDNIKKGSVTQIMFDGASNVQKAGAIIAQHYPFASVEHGAEHVVSLIFEKVNAIALSTRIWEVMQCGE